MIHLDPVVMLEEQPAIATASVLRFEQLRQFWTRVRMSSLSSTPVHPVPIIGTAVTLDLDMPGDGHLTMEVEVHRGRVEGRGGKRQTVVQSMPVPLVDP